MNNKLFLFSLMCAIQIAMRSFVFFDGLICVCRPEQDMIMSVSEQAVVRMSREYVEKNTDIPADIVRNMTVTTTYYPDVNGWTVSFRFFKYSTRSFYLGIEDNEIVECSYYSKSEEDIQRELAYYHAVYDSDQALKEWEKRYGPYPLWDVELNARFYSEYHHIPGETQQIYESRILHYDMPASDDISYEEAYAKADSILLDRLQVDEKLLTSFHVGSWFMNDGPEMTRYIFFYYNDDMQEEYRVNILSPSGLCYGAFYHYLQEEILEDFSKCFYSDIFSYTAGSYMRTDCIGAVDASSIDPNMVLYYNPEGKDYLEGSFLYHADPFCRMIKTEYTPLNTTFLYSQVNENPYNRLKPCPWCAAPGR